MNEVNYWWSDTETKIQNYSKKKSHGMTWVHLQIQVQVRYTICEKKKSVNESPNFYRSLIV